MPALAAGGAALAVLWTPVGLIEMLIASTGLSEAVPAAAPPLGLTARLLIAGFAGVMVAALVSAMGKDGRAIMGADDEFGGRDSAAAKGENKMGFALSKLAALARGRTGADEGKPTLRRADAHPDAPARAPIFASRDFDGLDIFNRTATRAKAESDVVPIAAPVPMPVATMPSAPKPWEKAQDTGPRFATPVFLSPDLTPPTIETVPVIADAPAEPAIQPPAIAPLVPTEGLTISQLTARLERGLAQRAAALPTLAPRIIADMPVAESVAVRDTVETGIDEALAAALGTLRTMAARVR